jgi:uncharacterized membrane protein YiaA
MNISLGRRSVRISEINTAQGANMNTNHTHLRPTGAFVGAAWASLAIGMGAYLIGLWNGPMQLNEKGFYFGTLMLGLFAAISLQKTVRDRLEGIPVTNVYTGVCWAGLVIALLMLTVGLFNAAFDLSVKGFYGMSYLLSVFAVVTVQKNVRDLQAFRGTAAAPVLEAEPRIDEAQ